MYEQLLLNFPIDAICLNEGEATIVEMVRAFSGEMPLKDVKGIAFKDINRKVIRTEPREYIKDLDTIPFPKHEYFLDISQKTKKAFIMASRGCPFKCSFCSASLHWGNVVRWHSPKYVVDEIEMLVNKYGINNIQFMNDTFTLKNEWVIEICKEIIKRDIHCKFACSGRVKPITAEMLEWMRHAGFSQILFGVESGSPEILQSLGKKFTLQQVKETIELCTKANIDTGMFFISGSPGETWTTIEQTRKFIKEVNQIRGRPQIMYDTNIMWIFPNTEVYNLAMKKGIIDDGFWLFEKKVMFYTADHSVKTLQKMAKKILWANWLSMGWGYYLLKIAPGYYKTRLHDIKSKLISNSLLAIKRPTWAIQDSN